MMIRFLGNPLKKLMGLNLAQLEASHCSICSWSGMKSVIYCRYCEEKKGKEIKDPLHVLVGSKYGIMATMVAVNSFCAFSVWEAVC